MHGADWDVFRRLNRVTSDDVIADSSNDTGCTDREREEEEEERVGEEN